MHTDRDGPPCTIAVIADADDKQVFAAEIAPSRAAQEVAWTQPAASRNLRIEASLDCPDSEIPADAMSLEFGFVTITRPDRW